METDYREVIILRGIPGSGKSTLAKKLVDEGWNRINKDDIRHMLNGYKLNNSDEEIVHTIQMNTLRLLMHKGRNIVIDNTHAKSKYVNELLRFISNANRDLQYDYGIHIKVMQVPLAECKRRNALREKPVMESVIDRMYEQLYQTDQNDHFMKADDIETI